MHVARASITPAAKIRPRACIRIGAKGIRSLHAVEDDYGVSRVEATQDHNHTAQEGLLL
jgi:hypothetical protein